MYLPFLNSAFSDPFIKALCWMFIHSLWQGIVLALMAAGMIQLTKKSGAVLRYHLLSTLFFLFVVTAMVTFFSEFKSPDSSNTMSLVVKAPALMQPKATVSSYYSNHLNQMALLEKLTDYLNAHALIIVLLWFVLFCAKSLQMLLNIGYIQKLRFYKTQTPSVFWTNKIKELSAQLAITRMVVLLESGIVKMPVVVGFFKPVILLPLGLLANIPPDEIEAILLHELAHIQRNDYFINLVQRFIEVVFFFNPALLWISTMIKEERENCCDDIAITVTNNKVKFIQALISFQEYNTTVPTYGMAFGNGKRHLLNRVKRIIFNKNKTLNTMEKTLFAGSIAAIVCLSFGPVKKIFSPAAIQNGGKESGLFHTVKSSSNINTLANPLHPFNSIKDGIAKGDNTLLVRDTIPTINGLQQAEVKPGASKNEITNFFSSINHDGNTTTLLMEATGIDGKKYKIKKENNAITAFYIDGVKIDDQHISDYQAMIDSMETAGNKQLKETALENKIANNSVQQKDHKKKAEDLENRKRDIDVDKISKEIKDALAKVDFQKINMETEKALKNIDWDKIKINVEQAIKEAQIQIKNIDTKKIKKQLEQSQQKIKNENWNLKIDKEKINKQVEEALSIAREQIEKVKIQNYKIDKQVEEALRIDQQQIEKQREPE